MPVSLSLVAESLADYAPTADTGAIDPASGGRDESRRQEVGVRTGGGVAEPNQVLKAEGAGFTSNDRAAGRRRLGMAVNLHLFVEIGSQKHSLTH